MIQRDDGNTLGITRTQRILACQQDIHLSLIRDQLTKLVLAQSIEPGSFIKVHTNIPNFKPVYKFCLQDGRTETPTPARKDRSKSQNMKVEPVFKYGSQLYLKRNIALSQQKQQKNKKQINFVQILKNVSLSLNEYIFFQIMIKGEYLTKKADKDVFLSKQGSNESIWTIQQVTPNNYHIFNISSSSFLSLKRPNERENKILFTSSLEPDGNTIFNIYKQASSNQFVLTPSSMKKNVSSSSLSKNDSKFGLIDLGVQLTIHESLQIRIQIVPVESSVASLFYQLKFAEHILSNNPSFEIIHQIIDQLIYYRLPEFGKTETLLSLPIQKLLSQFNSSHSPNAITNQSISHRIFKFIVLEMKQMRSNSQLCRTVERDVRLLCFGSQQNSQIFAKLITYILQSSHYQLYLPSLIKLIRQNCYFINCFQSYGWSRLIFTKLQAASFLQQFDNFHNLMLLIAQFCMGRVSIANKYLAMHTLQQMRDQTQKRSVDPINQNHNIWTRLFSQGQYVFVQVEGQNKLDQIQLQTFLNIDEKNRLKYIGQVSLIGTFCSGFNVNAINRYYQILKALSPYCYNQTFPCFTHPQCKQSTLYAISQSLNWNDDNKKLDNKFNIAYVFSQSQSLQQNIPANRTSNIREKAVTRPKLGYHKQTQTLTDVLKNLNKAFQNHVRDFLSKVDKNKVKMNDLIQFKDRNLLTFGSKIIYWIKIVQISLEGRLITMLKKKSGAYTQYFKKIFEKTKKQKSITPSKRTGLKKETSSMDTLSIADNQYQSDANLTLEFIIKIIKYNPIYEMYLKQMRIRNSGKVNKDRILGRVFTNSKSNYLYKQFESQKLRVDQNYNKILQMDNLILSDSQKREIDEINQIKLECFKTLALIYQNIIEEQVEQQVQNLGILAQGTNRLTNPISSSSIALEEGFKKFPYTDDLFKMSLIQNWYLASDTTTLDEISTCLRYVYDQPQIYIRAVNQTLLLFSKQTMLFYEGVQMPMSQLNKLSMCISTWYDARVLFSSPAYSDNYSMLIRALQGVNNQIRKLSIVNTIILQDYQQILENLGLIDIALNLVTHMNRFLKSKPQLFKSQSKKDHQKKDLRKQSQNILYQFIKILQFYVHFSDSNKKKIFIILGQPFTQSLSNMPFLMFMFRQSQSLQSLVELTNFRMLLNITENLPQSKEFLQILLMLNDFQYVKSMQKFTKCIQNLSSKQKQYQWEKSIISNHKCFQLLCKIAFRLILISNCEINYLKWFYEILVMVYVEEQVASNFHIKTKIIQNLNIQQIQIKSSLAYLIFILFYPQILRITQSNRKRKMQLYQIRININHIFEYGTKLKEGEGKKNISNYVLSQCLASNLQSDLNLKKLYIDYYINDLLPLVNICDQLLLNEDIKMTIFQKAEQYLTLQEEGLDITKSISNATDQNLPNSSKNIEANNSTSNDYSPDISKLQRKYKSNLLKVSDPNNSKQKNRINKIKQIQNILFQNMRNQQIYPRFKNLIPPTRPQQILQQKNHSINLRSLSKDDRKEDQFEKISKKAKKMWFKGRAKMNEYRQMYINRSKFLQDIEYLQTQYQNYQKQKEFVISSRDVLSKLISILLNNNTIKIGPQNQIFLYKICLVWLDKILQQKNSKANRKKNKNNEMNNKYERWYLIKKFDINKVMFGILQQIDLKLSSGSGAKNLICLCYQIKCCNLLIQLNDQNIVEMSVSELAKKVVIIIEKLTQNFELHRQLISLYEADKSLNEWELINCWEPIKLICEFSSFLILNFQSSFSEAKYLQDFCCAFLLSSAKLLKTKSASQNSIEQVIDLLKQINPKYVKDQESKLIINSDHYQCLILLG